MLGRSTNRLKQNRRSDQMPTAFMPAANAAPSPVPVSDAPSPAAPAASSEAPRYESAHARADRRTDRAHSAPARRPQCAGDARADLGGIGGNLFYRQARHRSARRRGAGVSGRDADANDVGWRHGRRHVVGGRARARRRTPRRCQCAGAACAAHRPRLRPGIYDRAPVRRRTALRPHGRQRRRARGSRRPIPTSFSAAPFWCGCSIRWRM